MVNYESLLNKWEPNIKGIKQKRSELDGIEISIEYLIRVRMPLSQLNVDWLEERGGCRYLAIISNTEVEVREAMEVGKQSDK